MPPHPLDPLVYDCFLSYRAARFDWVETLARNLVSQGLKVFLDRWGLIPGEDFPSQLDGALKASRAGLLVASPDTLDSEWVRNEWNRMLANRNAGRRGGAVHPFRIVPLLLGPMPGLPFIDNYHGIDFGVATDEPGYRRAFGMLVKALASEPPGPDPRHTGPLILPPGLAADRPMAPSQRGAIDEALLLLLRSPNPVAILAQRHYPLGRIAAVLAERLGEEYGPDRVIQIAPLNDPGTDGATYFAHLARQAGVDGDPARHGAPVGCGERERTAPLTPGQPGPPGGIGSAGALRHALEDRFRDDPWALVVRDFDQGPDGPRRALAAELRVLASGGRAHIAVLGGVHLAEQIYSTPELSLLRGASPVMLDDPTALDLVHWQRELFPDLTPRPSELDAIAERSGGHPRLIQHALLALGLGQDWRAALADTRPYEPLLTPYYPHREAVCALLRQGIPGLAQARDPDPLVRGLYWDNLLARRGGRYAWRSAGLKDAARLLLG